MIDKKSFFGLADTFKFIQRKNDNKKVKKKYYLYISKRISNLIKGLCYLLIWIFLLTVFMVLQIKNNHYADFLEAAKDVQKIQSG